MVNNSEIIIYQSADGLSKIDVRFEGETLWLTQAQISELFGRERSVITKHLRNIFEEGELDEKSNVQSLHIANSDKPVKFYSLDVILAVGYRVKSAQGTLFRQWATAVLHEYLQKGFAMNDEKLKEFGGGDYWYELLERIRDIRSSEKALYRQVLDLYATSVDYNPKKPETFEFFKIVQNKMHFAASKHTAAELIYERADSEQPFMGLTTFKGSRPRKTDIDTAKNYMTEDELFVLNRIVSAFFDIAELKARRHEHMYMREWIAELDKFTSSYGEGTLVGFGNVSHEAALDKANTEYLKYKRKTADELSPVEQEYFKVIKETQKKIERKNSSDTRKEPHQP
ncbi:MAG: virulence RhuM family protein [Oscillospiraceae bacterium]|nr:virulence RhuM family protein [Oscillospiraceae bacterium]